jgi:phosphonate transport system ATP-binding protein
LKVALQACSGRHPAARADAPDAIRALTLRVAAGEQVAVIGPSGAGKTTLLHLIACALRPSAGQVLLDDRDPWSLPLGGARGLQALRGDLFLAPQVPPLPPRQRVVTAVLAGRLPNQGFWQSLRSLVYPVGIDDAADALNRFDLAEKLFERTDRLSGGERQRVGLARALTTRARLFLVDEPLSALDPTRATQALAAVTAGARERGATLVATLHHVDMALRHFPRIIGLRDGALAFDLPSAEVDAQRLHTLYDQHLDELTASAPATPHPVASPAPIMVCR